jgi:hypothetical protein
MKMKAMQTIQFEADVKGGTIQIPTEFLGNLPKVVNVTLIPIRKAKILSAPEKRTREFTAEDFSAMKLDLKGWKFDREEANERR